MNSTYRYSAHTVDALRQQIAGAWDGVVLPDAFQQKRHDLSLLALTTLDACHAPRLEHVDPSGERANSARELAEKLAAHPSRTMDIRQLGALGVQSAYASGRPVTLPSEVAQHGGDKVAFTYGVPYVFSTATRPEYKDRNANALSIVVLDTEQLVNRPDLTIYGLDRGVLYIHQNPLKDLTSRLWNDYPGLQPTPLDMVYGHVLADPDRLETFDAYMKETLAAQSVRAEDVAEYMATMLAYTLPLQEGDEALSRSWRQTYAAEGNVDNSIPMSGIDAVITTHGYSEDARARVIDSQITVIDADHEMDSALYPTPQLRLLGAYASLIGASELSVLTSGQQ